MSVNQSGDELNNIKKDEDTGENKFKISYGKNNQSDNI